MPGRCNKVEKDHPFPPGVPCSFLFSSLSACLLSQTLSIYLCLSLHWWISQSIHPMIIFPLIYNAEPIMSILLPKPTGFPRALHSINDATIILPPFSLIPNQKPGSHSHFPLSLSSPRMKQSLKPAVAL